MSDCDVTITPRVVKDKLDGGELQYSVESLTFKITCEL